MEVGLDPGFGFAPDPGDAGGGGAKGRRDARDEK